MIEYGNPFEGDGASITGGEITTTGSGDGSDEWAAFEATESVGVTSTGSTAAAGAELSPLDARISESRWSREDVELAVQIAGAAATIAAVTIAYQRGA